MLDGPVEPVRLSFSLLLEGVVERSTIYQDAADFQKALEAWLVETGQKVEVSYVEVGFGDPPGDGEG